MFVSLPLAAEQSSDERNEHIPRIEQLQKECYAEGDVGVPFSDKTVFDRELDEQDKRTENLQEVGYGDIPAAAEDVPVGIVRGFTRPSHPLLEERTKRGKRSHNGCKTRGVGNGDGQSPPFE